MYIKVNRKWQLVFDLVMILIGTIIMGFAFSIFLEPNDISTGGFSGLSMIINTIFNKIGIHFLSASIIYFVLNIGLFLYAFKALGKRFALKAFLGILFFSLSMELCNLIPINITYEPLISAMYGGVLMGIGIGIVVRFGGSTGGGDMIASIVRRKNPKASIGMVVIIIDIIVIALSLFVFNNGVELLPYTIIALGIASVCTDLVNDGYKQVRAYYIITNKGQEIGNRIMNELHRGCSLTKVDGMHSHEQKDCIICLISKFQSGILTRIVRQEDAGAFVYSTKVSEVIGKWTKTEELNKEISETEIKRKIEKNKDKENIEKLNTRKKDIEVKNEQSSENFESKEKKTKK